MPDLQIPLIATIALLSLRVGVMLAFTPVFSLFPIPATARVLLVVALSVAIAGALRTPTMPAPDTGAFLALAAAEFSFGLLLACGIFCAFAAVAFAGRVLDIQIGFGIGQIFDPVSRAQVPVVTSVFMYSGALIFFLVDGHHALLRGLAHTLDMVPVGGFSFNAMNLPAMLAAWGKLYGLGFMLIAPVAVAILLIELGLGMLARGLPQMNVFVIALPVKILAGLAALTFWSRHMPAGLSRIFDLVSDVWNGAVR